MGRLSLFVGFAALVVIIVFQVSATAFPRSDSGLPKYEAQLLVNGEPLDEIVHKGRNYVVGRKGDRYTLRVRNNTSHRIEVVASVDGLDVVDGKKADYVHKRGYVLEPWQTYEIDGFRMSLDKVAAFRFASVADSYAARTGDARNVGVIGVAFFREKWKRPKRRPRPVKPSAGFRGRGGEGRSSRLGAASGPGDVKASKSKSEASKGPTEMSGAGEREARDRNGLGTEFGEARYSHVRETTFRRANRWKPTERITIRYNDRQGLIAMGVPVDPPCCNDAEACTRHAADPFPAAPGHRPNRRFSMPPDGWCR